MKPARFEYLDPPTVPEALEGLARYGEAKILAGGQSLVPLMNLRLARPRYLIDLNCIPDLAYIRAFDGGLAIGAMTRQRDVETAPLVKERTPLLTRALPLIGHLAIRNRGTVGGSLAHADPAAELPAVAVALRASFVLGSCRGQRVVDADRFFVSYLTTAIEADEMLLEIRVPGRTPGTGSAFLEMSRRHGDFALVGVAVSVSVDRTGHCTGVSGALAGVGPTPARLRSSAGDVLLGIRPDERSFAEVATRTKGELRPPADVHASADYRKDVAGVLVQRALQLAVEDARSDWA